jgi:hypothetical protein
MRDLDLSQELVKNGIRETVALKMKRKVLTVDVYWIG